MFYICIQCIVNTCIPYHFLSPSYSYRLPSSFQPVPSYCHDFFFFLCKVSAGRHSYCILNIQVAMSRHTQKTLFHRSPPIFQLYNLFFLFSLMSPSFGGNVIIVVLFMAETSQSFILSTLARFEALHSPSPTANSSSARLRAGTEIFEGDCAVMPI